MREATTKQQEIVNFISEYQAKNKVPPTLVEMASKFNITVAAIQQRITALERKKILQKQNIYIIKK